MAATIRRASNGAGPPDRITSMLLNLLLMAIFASSAVGAVTIARRVAGDKPRARAGATALGLLLWTALCLFAWIEPRLNPERLNAQRCVSGSEIDETFTNPVVLVRTGIGADYVAVETTTAGKLRINSQRGAASADIDPATGEVHTISTPRAITVCHGAPR